MQAQGQRKTTTWMGELRRATGTSCGPRDPRTRTTTARPADLATTTAGRADRRGALGRTAFSTRSSRPIRRTHCALGRTQPRFLPERPSRKVVVAHSVPNAQEASRLGRRSIGQALFDSDPLCDTDRASKYVRPECTPRSPHDGEELTDSAGVVPPLPVPRGPVDPTPPHVPLSLTLDRLASSRPALVRAGPARRRPDREAWVPHASHRLCCTRGPSSVADPWVRRRPPAPRGGRPGPRRRGRRPRGPLPRRPSPRACSPGGPGCGCARSARRRGRWPWSRRPG